jgi:hypothetical protein
MLATAPRLRAMGLADLLDTSFALYRQNFALFAGIAAVLGVPEAIINALLTALARTTVTTTSTVGQNVQLSGLQIGSSGGTGVVSLIFGALITGGLAFAIYRRYMGESVSIEGAYRGVTARGFLRLLGAIVLGALMAIAVFLAPLILLIAGIVTGIAALVVVAVIGFVVAGVVTVVMLVHWIFVPQIIVVEQSTIIASFYRSWRLVAGSAWRVLGIYIVLAIMVGVLTGIVGGVAGGVLAVSGGDRGVVFLATLISQFVGVLVQPFQLGALTLLYFDLRIRKEGFDLEQMVKTMDEPALP